MPFEQKPKKHILQNSILLFLVLQIVAASVWLIILYNQKVEYVNGAADIRKEIRLSEAKNVEAREKMFSLFHTGEMEQFAANLGLVKEQNPEYVEFTKPWVSASRY